jgi:glycosyltransferase involved in cell wall biosynthesis
MKVLHIIKSLGRGGAETLLPEMLKQHSKEGWEFHYIYFLPWKNQMVEALTQNGGRVTCLSAKNNIELIFKWKQVQAYIHLHKIDIVHCHLPWAGVLGRILYKKLKIVPVVYTEHNKQERYHIATRVLNRLTFNWQSAAIGVSGDVVQSIKKNIGVTIPVYEVLNGVNTEAFIRDKEAGVAIRQSLQIPSDALVVGTVAVFRFQKRLKEWLDVFAAATHGLDNVYGIIVGDGPLKEEIMQHRKKLGLEAKVFMPGLETNVKPWMSAMDVFMMSSVFEGLPIALLESMSMACAICTTDAGGIKEVIHDNENGYIAGVDDLSLLQKKLNQLLTSKSEIARLGHNARSTVIQSFSMKKMVSALDALYASFTKR